MFHKFMEEAGAVCYGSLMLSTNANKSGVENGFESVRCFSDTRRHRNAECGKTLNRHVYHHA